MFELDVGNTPRPLSLSLPSMATASASAIHASYMFLRDQVQE